MKILIVDDAKETRESLRNIIKAKINADYEIAEAEDGLEALDLVESFTPDIVLTDIMMPKMDGVRFTSILKSQEKTKHIFIAAITGLSGTEQIEKIYASGVDFYIAKPFQLDDIIARLKVITSLITHKNIIPLEKPNIIYNCFNDEHIKHYFTTFSITQEGDIFLIFDYFSKQDIEYNSLVLKDFMVTLVKTYRKMDSDKRNFDLIIEESEQYIYITVEESFFVNAIENLVDKHRALLEYKRVNDVCSFRIDIISFIDNSSNINDKVEYQNELISANELMIIASEDINEYIVELQEALREYETFCIDDDTYNDSLHLMMINLFDQYVKLFSKIPGFDRVSSSIRNVSEMIKEAKKHEFSKDENVKMIVDLQSLNIIITQWIDDVIINQECKDVHYSDSEIINMCNALEKDFG